MRTFEEFRVENEANIVSKENEDVINLFDADDNKSYEHQNKRVKTNFWRKCLRLQKTMAMRPSPLEMLKPKPYIAYKKYIFSFLSMNYIRVT